MQHTENLNASAFVPRGTIYNETIPTVYPWCTTRAALMAVMIQVELSSLLPEANCMPGANNSIYISITTIVRRNKQIVRTCVVFVVPQRRVWPQRSQRAAPDYGFGAV